MNEPTKEETLKWIDDQIHLLEEAIFEAFKGKQDAVYENLKKELEICEAIRRRIERQPEVDEEFIESWLEQNWTEHWCDPHYFDAILEWLTKLVKKTGVRIKEKEKP